jgi:peptide/nickel transport system substrate-binding protein
MAGDDAQFDTPEFLTLLRAGDERAYRRLIRRYHGSLVGVAQGIIGSRAQAEEVVQDAWLAVFRSVERFEGRSSLAGWIFTIVMNRARTRITVEGRTVGLPGLDGVERAVDTSNFQPDGHWQEMPALWDVLDPERLISGRQLWEHVQEAIERLPAGQKAVIILRDVENRSAEEACALLSVSSENQRVLLHRARGRVRAAIDTLLAEKQPLARAARQVSAPKRAAGGLGFVWQAVLGALTAPCRRPFYAPSIRMTGPFPMRLRSLPAAFGLAALLAGPVLPTPALAKDDLVIGVAQFPPSLNPNIDPTVIKGYVLEFVSRPLTAYDKDWKLTCMLCTELPTIENGGAKYETLPDGTKGLAVKFTLKPDLKWNDGTPVTTKDLLFTWKLGTDPKSGFSNNNPWDRAKSIDVIDDHTAVLHVSPVIVAYNQWDSLLPAHVEGAAAAGKEAGDYLKATLYNRAPLTPGLYNGPYMIAADDGSSQIVLTPNPYWPGQKPYFKRIVIKTIENTASLNANLLSGDVDLAPGDAPALSIDQVIALRKQAPDKFTFIFKPSLTYEHIDLKIENPFLQDLRVRQALLYAIDRETMVKKLFEGMQPVADTWVNPLDGNHTDDVMKYPYQPAKAKALLAEAGWKPGPDGICRNAKGEKLSFEIDTTAGNKLRELQEQVLQSNWKQACVDIVIKNEPARTLFGETMKKRTFTGMAMYGWSSAVNESPRKTLFSDQIPTAANNYGGANYIALSDKTMDADIIKAESELDPAKQKPIWADMQKIYAEQVRVLPLFFRAEPYVIPKWLKGFTPTGHGDSSALWAEYWTAE